MKTQVEIFSSFGATEMLTIEITKDQILLSSESRTNDHGILISSHEKKLPNPFIDYESVKAVSVPRNVTTNFVACEVIMEGSEGTKVTVSTGRKGIYAKVETNFNPALPWAKARILENFSGEKKFGFAEVLENPEKCRIFFHLDGQKNFFPQFKRLPKKGDIILFNWQETSKGLRAAGWMFQEEKTFAEAEMAKAKVEKDRQEAERQRSGVIRHIVAEYTNKYNDLLSLAKQAKDRGLEIGISTDQDIWKMVEPLLLQGADEATILSSPPFTESDEFLQKYIASFPVEVEIAGHKAAVSYKAGIASIKLAPESLQHLTLLQGPNQGLPNLPIQWITDSNVYKTLEELIWAHRQENAEKAWESFIRKTKMPQFPTQEITKEFLLEVVIPEIFSMPYATDDLGELMAWGTPELHIWFGDSLKNGRVRNCSMKYVWYKDEHQAQAMRQQSCDTLEAHRLADSLPLPDCEKGGYSYPDPIKVGGYTVFLKHESEWEKYVVYWRVRSGDAEVQEAREHFRVFYMCHLLRKYGKMITSYRSKTPMPATYGPATEGGRRVYCTEGVTGPNPTDDYLLIRPWTTFENITGFEREWRVSGGEDPQFQEIEAFVTECERLWEIEMAEQRRLLDDRAQKQAAEKLRRQTSIRRFNVLREALMQILKQCPLCGQALNLSITDAVIDPQYGLVMPRYASEICSCISAERNHWEPFFSNETTYGFAQQCVIALDKGFIGSEIELTRRSGNPNKDFHLDREFVVAQIMNGDEHVASITIRRRRYYRNWPEYILDLDIIKADPEEVGTLEVCVADIKFPDNVKKYLELVFQRNQAYRLRYPYSLTHKQSTWKQDQRGDGDRTIDFSSGSQPTEIRILQPKIRALEKVLGIK